MSDKASSWLARHAGTAAAIVGQVIVVVIVIAVMREDVAHNARAIDELSENAKASSRLANDTANTLAATAALVGSLLERQREHGEELRELRMHMLQRGGSP